MLGWLWILTGVLGSATLPAQVVISEFMASNGRTLADEDGDYPDWIELHNEGSTNVSLEGWFLTDDPTNLTKWSFPAVELGPDAYLVVFASDKDRRDAGGQLHTNFKLSGTGDFLALVKPDGVTLASSYGPAFPPQVTDVSFGRRVRPGDQVTLLGARADGHALVPAGPVAEGWQAADFAETAGWFPVQMGVGFDDPNASAGARILLVVNKVTTSIGRAGDQAVSNRLTQVLGHQVTVMDQRQVTTEDAEGYDLVMISATVQSPYVNTKFRDVPQPVINWEGGLVDDMLLSDSGANVPFQTNINITAAGATHPLGAGLAPGEYVVRETPTSFHSASAQNLAPGAVVVATAANGAPIILALDQGALRNDQSPSPGKRVHLFMGDAGVDGLNATGLALFDAAVAYALEEVPMGGPFARYLGSDVGDIMRGQGGSLLLRLPIDFAEVRELETLTLSVRFEDGFVAWLNGVEVARANAPDALDWRATAVTNRPASEAVEPVTFDLSAFVHLLQPGTNVLAIQVLNVSAADPDLLMAPELIGQFPPALAEEYYAQPTPGAPNQPGALGIVPPVEFSVPRGFYTNAFTLTLSCPLEETVIRYTTNGSPPSLTNGYVYHSPLEIAGTTVIRAEAYRPGYLTAYPVTMTYIFPEQVLRQPKDIPGWPRPVMSVGQGTRQHDYEMDPRIVDAPAYSNDVRRALLDIPTISLVVHQPDMWDANGEGGFYRGTDVKKPVSVEVIYPGAPERDVLTFAGVQGHSHDRLKRSLRLSFSSTFGDTKFRSTLFREAPLARGDEPLALDNVVLRGGNNRCWARSWNPDRTTYTEDEWYRATQLAMSGVGAIGPFVHLYINGLYWGLYNPVPRPDADFAAWYFGGDKDDYYSVSSGGSHGGNPTRWNYLVNTLANRNLADPANYAEFQEYLDVAEFVDYLLLSWYIGMADWPQNNWWAAIRNQPPGPARFFAWDGEWSWGVGASSERARVHPDFSSSGGNTSRLLPRLWHAARVNPDFMMLVADRTYRHVSEGGALSDAQAQARWDVLSNAVYYAVVAESARWGDTMNANAPRTRDVDWMNEIKRIRGLMEGNGQVLIASMRAEGYYPPIDPPTFPDAGGPVPSGFAVRLQADQPGTIYFTLDGSDPRLPGGDVNPAAIIYTNPVVLPHTVRVKTRLRQGTTWSALNERGFALPEPFPLRVTEIMYHPAPLTAAEIAAGYTSEGQFEFIELQNISDHRLGLEGAQFSRGIGFVFGPVTLEPGASVLVVKDRSAFATRYGTGLPVAGEFDGQLDNSGERLTLLDAFGQVILDFSYNDAWHPLSDGAGHSLVIVDPLADQALWSEPQGWRASSAVGGSPGESDPEPGVVWRSFDEWRSAMFNADELADPAVSGAGVDPDGDGRNNFEEYALGLNPKSADADQAYKAFIEDGQLRLRFKRLSFATDVAYRLGVADDINGPWRYGSNDLDQYVIDSRDGMHTVEVVVDDPPPASGRRFIKLVVSRVQ